MAKFRTKADLVIGNPTGIVKHLKNKTQVYIFSFYIHTFHYRFETC